MTISDHDRYRLHQRLDEVLGGDEAATLMEHLPPVGWADVATKRDLDHLGTAIRGELAAEIGGVRVEIAGLRGEMHQELGGLRAEMHQELGALRGELRGQLQTLFLGLVGLQMTGAGLAVALSRVL